MPWRRGENRKLMQFFVSNRIPFLITKARRQVGLPSMSAYCRLAICERIARDLGMSVEEIMADMPPDWQTNPGAVSLVNRVD